MKIIFAGSPAIAVDSLDAIASAQCAGRPFELLAVLTNPDKTRGRKNILCQTDVAAAANNWTDKLIAKGFVRPAVFKSSVIDDELCSKIKPLNADLLVSFAYGAFFPNRFLELFQYGGINIHPSLLPKYRGAAPLQQAIINGDAETGVSIQRLSHVMDAGAILAQSVMPLNNTETTETLSLRAAKEGARLLISLLDLFVIGNVTEKLQDENSASHCSKFKKEDGFIDWRHSACEINARQRAFTPWPLCWTNYNGQAMYLLETSVEEKVKTDAPPGTIVSADVKDGIVIAAGRGCIRVLRLQLAGKKPLAAKDFLNGSRDFNVGIILGKH